MELATLKADKTVIKEFKVLVVKQGLTMQKVVTELLEDYIIKYSNNSELQKIKKTSITINDDDIDEFKIY
jgi:hypothetical protein